MRTKHGIILMTLACLLLLVATGSAESKAKFGVKVGLSMYNFSGDATEGISTDSKTSVVFGGFAEIGVAKSIAIQPEINYITKGAKKTYIDEFIDGEVTEDVKMAYIQVPVLIKYMIPTKGKLQPSFFVGPALAFNMSGKDEITGYGEGFDGDMDIANVKSTDFGVVVGAGVTFPLGKMMGSFGVRYDKSFGKAFDDIDPADVPEGEVAFVHYDHDAMEYGSEGEDLINGGLSFDIFITFPVGGGENGMGD